MILTHLSILETVSDDGKVNYVHTYGKTPNSIVSALVKKSGISSRSFFYSTLQIQQKGSLHCALILLYFALLRSRKNDFHSCIEFLAIYAEEPSSLLRLMCTDLNHQQRVTLSRQQNLDSLIPTSSHLKKVIAPSLSNNTLPRYGEKTPQNFKSGKTPAVTEFKARSVGKEKQKKKNPKKKAPGRVRSPYQARFVQKLSESIAETSKRKKIDKKEKKTADDPSTSKAFLLLKLASMNAAFMNKLLKKVA